MNFNLEQLNVTTEETYDLELIHPVHGATGLYISHKSSFAPDVVELSRKQGNELLKEQFATQRKGKFEDVTVPTIERSMKRGTAVLIQATSKWFEMGKDKAGNPDPATRVEGWPFGKGRIEFSPENAAKIYSDPGFAWIREQLDESIAELKNFTKP